jgi:phenylalanyl-tRNA synthetase beta chain
MLCSGGELLLTEDDCPGAGTDGILQLSKDVAPGTDIKEALGLGEYVLDISVTANRPDCQSVYGLAREASALLGRPLKPPETAYTADAEKDISDVVEVVVKNLALCPRYMAAAVSGVKIEPSPANKKKRLRLCGLRPVNNLVDITNYILLELGQPMHVFDTRYLRDKNITVRTAEKGEKIKTLNGKENALTENVLVITDGKTPVAVAGVMGGEGSGVKDDTTEIVFESAKFARDNIRKTARTLNLRTDASARYEKGVDFASPETALSRALYLVQSLRCGNIVKGVRDVYEKKPEKRTITAEFSRLHALLGIVVENKFILDILGRLGFAPVITGDTLSCVIPPYREDIDAYPDVAEEIIRYYGYDHIRPTLLTGAAVLSGGRGRAHTDTDRLKATLVSQGYSEAVSYAFIPENAQNSLRLPEDRQAKTIKIENPISDKMAVMRTNLLHSMLETLSLNISRKNPAGRLFEVGNIYLPKELPLTELPSEKPRLCFAAYGALEDFFTLKGTAEALSNRFGLNFTYKPAKLPYMHGGRCAAVYAGGEEAGYLGEAHPSVLENYGIRCRVYAAELDLSILLPRVAYYGGFKPIPKFPEIKRDVAVVLDEKFTCGEVTETITAAGGGLLKGAELFDIYRGPGVESGKKSFAFSLLFGAEDRTLKIEEADGAVNGVLKALEKAYSAKLRQ